MSEKYTIVQHEKRLFWLQDCPVLLHSYALTKNNTNNSIFLQCKFENIADKPIKAMNIAVKCSDIAHKQVTNIDNFSYLDISVQPYSLFGDKTPVVLPDNTTRNVSIIPLKVIFSDDTTWENTSERAYELAEYEQQPISSLGELADQYKRDLHKICADSDKHNYLPTNVNGFTVCGCGKITLNSAESCPQCHVFFQKLFDTNDAEKLQSNLSHYNALLEEQAQKDEEIKKERQRQAELAKQKFKTTAKKVSIIGGSIIAIAALGILTKQVIIPNVQYSNAERLLQNGEYDEAVQTFTHLGDFKDASEKVLETKYDWAKSKLAQGDTEGAISLFSMLGDYSDAKAQATEIQNQVQYDKAMSAFQAEKYDDAQALFSELGSYKDSSDKVIECKKIHYSAAKTALNKNDTDTALHEFLKAVPYGDSIVRARTIGNLDNKLSAYLHTVGLLNDGTVITAGVNDVAYHNGEPAGKECQTDDWINIKKVSAGMTHTIGLRTNGTVLAAGYNEYGECDVSAWTNIVDVCAGEGFTVGLKSDGTVVVTDYNDDGQCNVSNWRNIIALSRGAADHIAAIKSDGTVVAAGTNDSGQCNVSDWKNITDICTGFGFFGKGFTLGLKKDGTVVAAGDNDNGQCNVSNWKDIVAVSAGHDFTVGLKSDGTVVATGYNYYGQCNVSGWKDIVAISTGFEHTVGLKSDGTLVAVGNNSAGACDVSDWKLW